MGKGSANPTNPHHTPTITQPSSSQPQKKQTPRKPLRKNTEVPQPSGSLDIVADEVVYKERDDSLVRAATSASSLEAEQDSGNINKTRSKATLNEPSSIRTNSGSGPRVLDLEQTKTAHDNEIAKLKKRVKKLDQERRSRTHGLKRLRKVSMSRRVDSFGDEEDLGEDASKQGRKPIDAIDEDDNITLRYLLQINTAATTVTITPEEITLAQALQELRTAKPKDKGKGKMVEPEPVKKFLKKYQIRLDEELAFKLQVEEEERHAREKYEANVALTEEWNDIQAKIEAD
ncbi:hypothetical protein Tco_0051424 [Tanacetum coccineum]